MAIAEFPGLQIDDFRTYENKPRPSLCLLTHMHSDHLNGLERQSYHSPTVYCSAATRAMVLNLRNNNGDGPLKYNHLRKESGGIEVLKSLAIGVPHKLVCANRYLQVTPIETVHCPGATMFLVDDGNLAILFTGDIRCEEWHVNTLSHHPALLPFTLGGRPLAMYVDSTFEQHEDPDREYEDNFTGIASLLEAVCPANSQTSYPATAHFALVASTTGYEDALIALALRLETKVHMDSYRYHLYLAAADTCSHARQLVELATLTPSDAARVHWCRKGFCDHRDDTLTVYLSPRVTMNPNDMTERNQKLDVRDFPGGAYTSQTLFVHAVTGIRYILAQDTHTLLPGHIYFNFSRHASLPELMHFCSIFPKTTVRSLQGERVPALAADSAPKELKIYKKKPWSRPPPRKKQPTQASSSDSHPDILDFLNAQAQESSLSTPPGTPRKPLSTFSVSTIPTQTPPPAHQAGSEHHASPATVTSIVDSLARENSASIPSMAEFIERLMPLVQPEPLMSHLEEQLRADISKWFEIEFDWKTSPIYGYK